MKQVSFIKAMTAFLLVGIAVCVIGGDLNPNNTPSPTMRTLDELYKNIQPGLPSDWKPFPTQAQSESGGAINMTIEGAVQGQILGSCTVSGREGTMVIVGQGYQAALPVDPETGLITGHLVSGQFYVTKYIDKATPKLYKALCTGEQLSQVWLKFYRADAQGQQQHYYTILLNNAGITSIRSAYPNLEEIGFTVRSITWTYEPEGISYQYEFRSSI